ncbi:MAG: disulfide bond formation protein B [bacterium]|nr:disulfide bond formation protein B [bacterium]
MTLTSVTNQLAAIGTIGGQIVIVLLLVSFFMSRKGEVNKIVTFFGKNAILFAFLIALTGMLLSLWYSQVIGFTPCTLCWVQRIFLYPQVIILGIALFNKDKHVGKYAIALSTLGALVASYHYYLEFGGTAFINCGAVGGISCSQRLVYEFGYITIPLMALTSYLMIIGFFLSERRMRS